MNALIIGCGKIAGGFNQTDESAVLTHAVAYRRLGVEITGCVDRHAPSAAAFATRWHIPHHGDNLATVLQASQPDVVSLSTPPEGRAEALEIILQFPGIRAVLIEKPLAATISEARRVRDLAQQKNIPLVVNYLRAFDPFYQKVAQEFRAGTFGQYRSGTARYYGSAESNASHWLERVFALFGLQCTSRRLGGTKTEPLFELTFADRSLQFLPSPGSDFCPFELDLLFDHSRLRIVDSERRVEFSRSRPDPSFPGYAILAPESLWDGMAPSHESILQAVQSTLEAAAGCETGWQGLLDRAVAAAECLGEFQ